MKYAVLLLLPTLLLASCRGQDTPAVTTSTSVSGTVREFGIPGPGDIVIPTTAWTGGAGTVKATITDGGTQGATSAALNGSGAFTLTLPTAIPAQSLSSDIFIVSGADGLSCTGTPTVSDPAAQFATLEVEVAAGKSGPIAPGRLSQTGAATASAGFSYELGVLIYADRPVSITGSQTCTLNQGGQPSTVTTSLNLNLGLGWNKATTTANFSYNAQQLTLTGVALNSGAFPTEEWIYLDSDTLASAALHRPALKLPAGLSPFKFSGLR